MEQPRCAECLSRIAPEHSVVARLGQFFHAPCYEQRERRFQALTRHTLRRRRDPEPPPKALALSA
jgi:hypothetical protein